MTNHYDKLVYIDEYGFTRVQTASWDQEVSDEDIEEIGNSGIVETIIDPIIPTTVTINTNDWGVTDPLAQMMGTEADVNAGSPYDVTVGNMNDWIVNSSDMNVQMVDVLFRVRDNTSGNIDRTVWIPNCGIQSINWAYSVDGNATENFTLRGTTDRHFLRNYRQGYVDIGTYASADTFNVTTTQIATQTFLALYYSVNGTIYDATGYTWADAGTVVDISGCTGEPTLVAGDRIRLFYYMDTPDDAFTELDSGEIGAIKAPYVVIGLGEATETSSTTKTLRLQSVDVNVNVTREDLKEIGTVDVIRSVMTKQDVTVDATVLEDDLQHFAAMLGVDSTAWTTGDVEIKLQDSIGVTQELFVRVYDDSSQTNLLKTLTCTDLRLTSAPFSHDVGGQGQYNLSLKGDNWSWAGGGDVGRLVNTGDAWPTNWPKTID
jgi:hypothetical protein